MAKKANPALIGAFVLVAIALSVAALVIFGGGKFFRQTQKAVLYFEGSVKGLTEGSPVTFHGVKIGQVTQVRVVIDRKTLSIRTPVVIEIEANRIYDVTGAPIRLEKATPALQQLIDRGFRAQMQVQSFVTGQLAVDLDFYPNTPVRLTGLTLLAKEYPELPTIPSSLEQLARTIETLPIAELVNDIRQAAQGIDRLVASPDIQEILRNGAKLVKNTDEKIATLAAGLDDTLRDARKLVQNVDGWVGPVASGVEEALADARRLVQNVDGRVGPVADDLEKTLRGAQEVFAKAQVTLAGANDLVDPGSPVSYNLNTALESVARAADSIRQLANYLAENPNAVVFGRGRP